MLVGVGKCDLIRATGICIVDGMSSNKFMVLSSSANSIGLMQPLWRPCGKGDTWTDVIRAMDGSQPWNMVSPLCKYWSGHRRETPCRSLEGGRRCVTLHVGHCWPEAFCWRVTAARSKVKTRRRHRRTWWCYRNMLQNRKDRLGQSVAVFWGLRIKEHPTRCCKETEMVDHAAGRVWSSALARLLHGGCG